jgi:hypothetical protein
MTYGLGIAGYEYYKSGNAVTDDQLTAIYRAAFTNLSAWRP